MNESVNERGRSGDGEREIYLLVQTQVHATDEAGPACIQEHRMTSPLPKRVAGNKHWNHPVTATGIGIDGPISDVVVPCSRVTDRTPTSVPKNDY